MLGAGGTCCSLLGQVVAGASLLGIYGISAIAIPGPATAGLVLIGSAGLYCSAFNVHACFRPKVDARVWWDIYEIFTRQLGGRLANGWYRPGSRDQQPWGCIGYRC